MAARLVLCLILASTVARADELVKKTHLDLIKNYVVSWSDVEFGAPTIEPAAPYGSHELVADIQRILGVEMSEKDALELHTEAFESFKVFLEKGSLEPGTYRFEDKLVNIDLSLQSIDVRAEEEDD